MSEEKNQVSNTRQSEQLLSGTQARSRHSARLEFKPWKGDHRQNLLSRETTLYKVEGKRTVFLNWDELKNPNKTSKQEALATQHKMSMGNPGLSCSP